MKIISVIAVLSAALLGEKMESSAVQVPDNMALIPAGSFDMGNPFSTFYPITHPASVSEFYMDKYEVTMALWNQVYEWAINHGYSFDNTGTGKAANHPVYGINWYDMVKWCNARSEKEGYEPSYYTDTTRITLYKTGNIDIKNEWVKWDAGYRLPTETEWERAARGGLSGKRFPWGDTISHSQANYYSAAVLNYDISPTRGFHPEFKKEPYPYTSPVGYFPPNNYGLYDIAGNVWELCWDWYSESYTRLAEEKDYRGPDAGNKKSLRGGSFNGDAWGNGVGFRNGDGPYTMAYQQVGFRTVLSVKASAPRAPMPDPIHVIKTQTVQPTYSEPPKKEIAKDSLVVVTHGWNPDVRWVDDMTNAITTYLTANGLNNWQVSAYRWVEKAQTSPLLGFIGAEIVLRRGRDEGNNLGDILKKQGWKHVHFIGHSAGAALIQAASTLIKESDITVKVHTTFLDPYVGLTYGGRGIYGAGSDFSDSYFARDAETFDILTGLTGGSLNFAYNVNVTSLDPNKTSRGTFRSSWNGDIEQCYRTVTSHEWAHQFYLKTIGQSWPEAKGLGFPLSQEGGGWDFAKNQYKSGNNPPLPLGTPDPSCVPDITPPPPSLSPFLDLAKPLLIKSPTGTIEVKGNGLKLITGSPVWVAVDTKATNIVNLLSLEVGFFSGTGAEGLLSVYWGTNILGSIDERVSPALQQYTFALPARITGGNHLLGFRLDAFSAMTSSAVVTNITLGFVGIRETFSLSATGKQINGLPILQLNGPAGYNYAVEVSTNLVNWKTIATLVNTNGIVRFTDSVSTSASSRFYRAVAN